MPDPGLKPLTLPIHPVLVAVASAAFLCGCATEHIKPRHEQIGESVVFISEEPANLAFIPTTRPLFRVRSQYLPGADAVVYVEGRDFTVDYAAGSLQRTPNSPLPDFRANKLFGQESFNHAKFPGYGNAGFFAFVDYSFSVTNRWPRQQKQAHFLKATQTKLRAGGPFRIVAFGDSI